MKVVLQRVKNASVEIEGIITSGIKMGILIFVGIEEADGKEDIDWLCSKIANLRIFDDDNGVMNMSVKEVDGDILAISQFTLHARVKKGNRPSYVDSAKPEISIPLYNAFVKQLENELGKKVNTGKFGAEMQISLINDGPVTINIDSKNRR
ncbi:D-aminoacyl-tRNA deacylase [Bacteroidota bacterium]